MNTFTIKTYADSYLYNNKLANSKVNNPGSANNREISNFIITSHRIDKNSSEFNGVIEDIKRQHTSAALLAVLLNPNVVLCIGEAALPRAFSVFEAKDPKFGGKHKVFIDVTGRIEFKDGYYVARRNELDKLCSLIFDALIYILYRTYANKFLNSNNIITPAINCYVDMFTWIIDYLRVIGYSENKKKISYIVGLYFIKCMLGKDLDDYNRSIAAKAAGISINEARAYDLYISDESMFDNIGTFLPSLVQTFNLKGLDLPTFINRWMKSFGTGTEYGTELFTSFLCMVVNAYTGSYIVQQRQIETACGSKNMITLSTNIIKIGVDCLNMKSYFGEASEVHSINTEEFAKSMNIRNNINASDMVVKSFDNKESALKEAKEIISKCKAARAEDRLHVYAENSIDNGITHAYNSCIGILKGEESTYENGSLINVSKVFKNQVNDKQRYHLENTIDRDTTQLRELIREAGASKETNSIIAKVISELLQIRQYI